MPRIATSSSMIASSSICCHSVDVDACPTRSAAPGRRGTRPCAPTGRRRASAARRARARAAGRQRVRRRRAVRRGEAVPDRLRRLDRDLLADDRAGQRGEGVAAAFAAGRRRTAGSACSSPGRAATGACRRRPSKSARRPGRLQRSRGRVASSGPHPGGAVRRVLEHDALRRPSSSRMRVGAGEVARPSWRRARASMRCGDAPPRRRRCRACRKARGACCSRPSVAPSALQQRARARPARARLTSAARSNSTATASGVLKSSFIASRKAAARGSFQSSAPASPALDAVERGVEAAQRSPRVVEVLHR